MRQSAGVSPLFLLLVQIVVVVAVARAVGALSRRLGQPRVIGEIVAGLLLGPSFLGWIAPAAIEWLFPPDRLELLNAFSQFGLVLFMFLVGMRLDLSHLRDSRKLVLLTSATSMLVPFGLGVGLAVAISSQFHVEGAARLPFALFVGLSLSITAFPVLVRIVTEHRLASTRLGTVAIACAAFDDVTAWVVLAVVTSLARANTASAGTSVVWLVVYGLLMVGAVRPLLRWWLARITDADAKMTLLVIGALASSAATERLGVHPLFGAFFFGALAPRDLEAERLLTSRIEPLVSLLLLPLFFAFTGLRTNVHLMTSPWLVGEAAIILVIAVAGKAASPLIASNALSLSRREAFALGVLMNTRGLVELVVLNIGVDTGILPPLLFTMLTLMALITTAMTSPLLEYLGFSKYTRRS
jgi:Kef-type K+ transport system membrane component KefB